MIQVSMEVPYLVPSSDISRNVILLAFNIVARSKHLRSVPPVVVT
jgi:hypothetical protein